MYGMIVRNSVGNILIDSERLNYQLMEKFTDKVVVLNSNNYYFEWQYSPYYNFNQVYTNYYWFDVTFANTYINPPLVGFRSSSTAGALTQYKTNANGHYTGVYISAEQGLSGSTADIFIYANVLNDSQTYGLLVRNSSGELVFTADRQLLRYVDKKIIPFAYDSSVGHLNINATDLFLASPEYIPYPDTTFTHDTSGTNLPILILTFMGWQIYSEYYYSTNFLRIIGLRNVSTTSSKISIATGAYDNKTLNYTYFPNNYSLQICTYIQDKLDVNPIYQTILLARD
jgi:hypothetical protein